MHKSFILFFYFILNFIIIFFGQNRIQGNLKIVSDLRKIRRKKYLTTIRLNIKFRFRYIIIHRSSTPTMSLYCCFKFAFLCTNWFIIGFKFNSEFLITIVLATYYFILPYLFMVVGVLKQNIKKLNWKHLGFLRFFFLGPKNCPIREPVCVKWGMVNFWKSC